MRLYGSFPCFCGLPTSWDTWDQRKSNARRCTLCEEPCEACRCPQFKSFDEVVEIIAQELR